MVLKGVVEVNAAEAGQAVENAALNMVANLFVNYVTSVMGQDDGQADQHLTAGLATLERCRQRARQIVGQVYEQ